MSTLMRRGLVVIVGLSLASWTGSLVAADDPADEDPRNAPALSEGQARAIAKVVGILDTKARLDVIETPLEDVCKDLEEKYKLKISLDDENLKLAGLTRQTLITIYEKDKSLRVILRKVLEPRGLTFLVRTDGLLITK